MVSVGDVGEHGGDERNEHIGGHVAGIVRELNRVVVGGVGHLVAENPGQFVVGADHVQQARIDVDVAAGERKGVHFLSVDDIEGPGEGVDVVVAEGGGDDSGVGDGGEALADLVDALQGGGSVDSFISCDFRGGVRAFLGFFVGLVLVLGGERRRGGFLRRRL